MQFVRVSYGVSLCSLLVCLRPSLEKFHSQDVHNSEPPGYTKNMGYLSRQATVRFPKRALLIRLKERI